jgi:hypothetical protein
MKGIAMEINLSFTVQTVNQGRLDRPRRDRNRRYYGLTSVITMALANAR